MKRTALKRKTPLKGRSATKRTAGPQRRPEPNGFPEATRVAARRRSGGRCEAKLRVCTETAAHFHHRKLRRHKDHTLANCLHVCSACHDHIHANPTKAYLMGMLVHEWLDPGEVPVKYGAAA